MEFQALLDEDDLQTQIQLSINQQAVSNWLQQMRKIQKISR